MRTSDSQLEKWLQSPEGPQLEFKEARTQYDFFKLIEYCVALANEKGGKIILGASDKRPRTIVGTQAFEEPGHLEARLYQQLQQRIGVEEIHHDSRQILILHIPSRLPGTAWNYQGKYLKRAGDALTAMDETELRQIFTEIGPDFTAEKVPNGDISLLDERAIKEFRARWKKKNPALKLDQISPTQLLSDADLLVDECPNYAALILLGTPAALRTHLAQAEIIFEYRSSETAGPAADRVEFRSAFLRSHEQIRKKINLRNDRQSFQQDFFRYDIPTFDEVSIREAILNAICHRDYRAGGSIFIRQYNRRLEVTSPGGFPLGITAENIADQQNPRNCRLAEVLNKCGFIERSGQGVNLMIEHAVRQTKPLPDFSQSAAHEVFLKLSGTVQNPAFMRYLEQLGENAISHFQTLDFITLDSLAREEELTRAMKGRLPNLMEIGAIESSGRGKGQRFFLSRELYEEMGSPGSHTRKKGLDHETNKALLIKHLRSNQNFSARMGELQQVLPAQSRASILRMLNELKKENLVSSKGKGRGAFWELNS